MIAVMHDAYPDRSIRRWCALVGAGRTWWYPRPAADEVAARDPARRAALERVGLEFPGDGSRRVTKALPPGGWDGNHQRGLRVLRQEALVCQLHRRFVVTTAAAHGRRTSPTRLAAGAVAGPDRTGPGWPPSPPSGCRRPAPTWPVSSPPGRGEASAGSSRAGSIPT